jgi:amidohydrolase
VPGSSDIRGALQERRERILALSHRIHAEPELAFEEHKTSALLRETLAAEGFALEPGPAALPTSFRALRRGRAAGPCLTFTAEMDALPQIGHGCGHNIIAAAGAYAPIVLAAALGEDFPGSLQVIGTPAEERGSGKVSLLEAGAFAGSEVVLQMHPHSLDTVICQAMARRTIVVEYFGRAAHAAAAPQEGLNALDAMVLFYQSTALARQQFPPGCLFHGIIEQGGGSANVIPDYTRGRFSLRAERMEALAGLEQRVRACAAAAAQATGCRLGLEGSGHPVSTFRRNRALEELFAGLFESIGRLQPRRKRRSFGSTDLANVSQAVPAIEIFLKASDQPIHTEGFARDSAGPGGDRALLDGIYLLASAGMRLLREPELLEAVRASFAAGEPPETSEGDPSGGGPGEPPGGGPSGGPAA